MCLAGNEAIASSQPKEQVMSTTLTHSEKYPSPAKAKLLCPLGKLLHPSCKTLSFGAVHTSIPTSLWLGVSSAGWQRSIRSGLGLPTAFLTTSVKNRVSIKLIRRPRSGICDRCRPGRVMMIHNIIDAPGTPLPTPNIHAAGTRSCKVWGNDLERSSIENMRWNGRPKIAS